MRALLVLIAGLAVGGCVLPLGATLTIEVKDEILIDPDPTSDWQLWKCVGATGSNVLEVQAGGIQIPVRLGLVQILPGKEADAQKFLSLRAKNQIVRLQSDPAISRYDPAGRPLVYVWVLGWLINEELIKAGLAVYDYSAGRSSMYDKELGRAAPMK